MTSLKFIEKEINHLEIVLSCMVGKDAKKDITNKLNHFQQLKSELETFYILHDKLEFSVIKVNTKEGTKYHLGMKGYNSLISEEEYEVVNKVLEVEDD